LSIRDKLLKNSSITETSILKESKIFLPKDLLITDVPALNIALSGQLDSGMGPGLLQIAGASKRFKSKFALLIANIFIKKFPNGAILFYDSEFGTPNTYFNDFDNEAIKNIIHSPVTTIEQLKHDIIKQISEVSTKDGDKIFIIIDSLGNLSSRKEVEDAIKSAEQPVDMTRAKTIKSLFRLVGPLLPIKEIYLVVINHTYQTLELYSTEKVGGGTGTEYNSNGIWIIGASKNTEGQGADRELVGFDFNIKVEKSRFVKQGTKIPITVSFDSGIDKWSGLLQLGVEAGYIIKPTAQTYALAHKPEEAFKEKKLVGNDAFFQSLLKDTDFPSWVEKQFVLK
jgi:RecA/RadA recombinase